MIAENASTKRYHKKYFLRDFGAILMFLKEVRHLCTENILVTAHGNIFNGIVTLVMEKFSTPSKRKSEWGKSGMKSNHAVLGLIVTLQDSPR